MEEQLYKVLFDGTLTGEHDLSTTKLRFAKLFDLNTVQTAKLFCGKKFTIKNNATETEAMKLSENVVRAGGKCYLEKIAVNIVNKRQEGSERRLHFRRAARPCAIVPDRRVKIRRRKNVERVDELILKELALPVAYQAYSKKNH